MDNKSNECSKEGDSLVLDTTSESFISGYSKLDSALDSIVLRKKLDTITYSKEEAELFGSLFDKINVIINNLSELDNLASDLIKGNVDGFIPSRHNYMAGKFKDVQSRLFTLAWSLRQLQQGRVVSPIEGDGELYASYNDLLRAVSEKMLLNSKDHIDEKIRESELEWSMGNSWRFHKLQTALNYLRIAIIEVSEDGTIEYANQQGRELLKGKEKLDQYDVEKGNEELFNVLAKTNNVNNVFPMEYEVHDKDTLIWYKITTEYYSFATGKKFFLNIIDDINDWKQSETQLIKNATTDGMTGTLNREAGLKNLSEILYRPYSEDIHCAAFIDLDGLKNVNDNYGHREGDYFIKTISHILLSNIRDTDKVIRYGGDEFLVVFENCSLESAEKVIQRMYMETKKLNDKGIKPYIMSFSHGLVNFKSNSNDTVAEILANADMEMYELKRKKKLRIGEYKPNF